MHGSWEMGLAYLHSMYDLIVLHLKIPPTVDDTLCIEWSV